MIRFTGPLVALLATFGCTAALYAQDLKLHPPIGCDLQLDCYIQQYMDRDPGPGAQDYRCASLSYNDHSGTDFALVSLAQMHAGVDVVASAAGTVHATRDGMIDQVLTQANAAQVAGRDCGNGVVITHSNGWETQYCHLRRGSITVQTGDQVQAGEKIGQIGLSGRTQFPHVDLTVRRNGRHIDPFDPLETATCDTPPIETLWVKAPPYRPGGLLSAGFSDQIPDYAEIKAGTAAQSSLPVNAPAIVLFGYAFGGEEGDIMTFDITGSDDYHLTYQTRLDKNQAQFFRAYGKRSPENGWEPGSYHGRVTLERGNKIISVISAELKVSSTVNK